MKGPAESGQICSVGRRKIAKKIAKNKRCYANTLLPRSRMLLKPCTPMATYAHGNFEQIATAIGMEVGQIAKHENRFEAAAYWYRLDRRRPTRMTQGVMTL